MKIFAALIVFALHSVALGQNICFPLQVGTRWQFQGQPLAEYQPSAPKEIIKDTIMENGKKYSVLLYDGAALPEYIRAQNDSVFVYSIYEKQESLAYRFNAHEKDTVATRIRGKDTTDVILIDTTIAKIFGKSVRQFIFLIDVRHYIDDERSVTIADSIGVTRISDAFGYVSSIQGAFINGIKYGTIYVFPEIYYPLDIGNQWAFNSPTKSTIKVVADSLFSNGYRYSVLNQRDFAGGQYVRVDSHFVYYYDQFHQYDVPFFKLDGKKGDITTFAQGCNGSSRSIILAIDTTILFGEKTRTIRYQLDELTKREVTLSDKFGIVKVALFADPPPPWADVIYDALGCFIDGRKYGTITSVNRAQTVPSRFGLSQNYPNPFNPATTIRFSLTEGARVRLVIFDCTGREVAELVSATLPPGEHMRIWDASKMSSGVYFYRLQAGAYAETRRMVLIR